MAMKSLSNYKWKQYNVPRNIPCPSLHAVFNSTGSVTVSKKGRGKSQKQKEHIYNIYQCLERMEWIPWNHTQSSLTFNEFMTEFYNIYVKLRAKNTTLSTPNHVLSYFVSHYLKALPSKNNVKICISYKLLTQLFNEYKPEIDKRCPYLRHIIMNNNKIFKIDYNKHFTIRPIDIDEKAYDENIKNKNNNSNNKDIGDEFVEFDDEDEYITNFSKTVFENSKLNTNTNTKIGMSEMECKKINENDISSFKFFLVEDKPNKRKKNQSINNIKLRKKLKKQLLIKYLNANYYVLSIKQSGLCTIIIKIKSRRKCVDNYINLLIGPGGEEFHSRIGVIKVCGINELLKEVNQCYEATTHLNDCNEFVIQVYPHTFRHIKGTNIGLVVFDSYAGSINEVNDSIFELAKQLPTYTYKRFIFSIIFVIIISVYYLFTLSRFHNDIKPANIFFRRNKNKQNKDYFGIDIVLGDHGQGLVSNRDRNITLRNDNIIGTDYFTPELLFTNFSYEYVQIAQIGLTAFYLNEGYKFNCDCNGSNASNASNDSSFHSFGQNNNNNNNDEDDILESAKATLMGNMNCQTKMDWLTKHVDLNFGLNDIDRLIGEFYVGTICNDKTNQKNMIDLLLNDIFYKRWGVHDNVLSIAEEFIKNHNCLQSNNAIYRIIVEKAKHFQHN